MTKKLLITDFDGTMAEGDFYKLVREHLVPRGTPDPWDEYHAGRLTHFDALNGVFALARPGEDDLLALTEKMGLDPDVRTEIEALRKSGWDIVVASAGCRWYIEHLLTGAGVELTVHANPGQIEKGRLVMRRSQDSPVYSHETGVDKVGVVRQALESGSTVAFAGDSMPDLAPALAVPPELRFATGQLAEELEKRGEPFRPFERWSEVARALRGTTLGQTD